MIKKTILCLSVFLASCTFKVGPVRVGEFVSDTVAPPFGKLGSTLMIPCSGWKTIGKLEKLEKAGKLGYFRGEPRIIPLGPNLFWFYQPDDPKEQFSFTTSIHSPYSDAETWTIVPKSMIFDGATVPRVLWHVKSYGPFDFTKSAIIHDWLFEAHHRAKIYRHAIDKLDWKEGDRKTLEKVKREFFQLAMYVEEPYEQALAEDGSGKRRATQKGLDIESAGWIMVEAMYREMLSSRVLMELTKDVRVEEAAAARECRDLCLPPKNLNSNSISVPANVLRGIDRQIEPSLSISLPRRHILGLYRFAIDCVADSFGYWNPKPKRGLDDRISPHASSITTLNAFFKVAQKEKWKSKLDPTMSDTPISREMSLLLGYRPPIEKSKDSRISPGLKRSLDELKQLRELIDTINIQTVNTIRASQLDPGIDEGE
jgi:hypothetical protein